MLYVEIVGISLLGLVTRLIFLLHAGSDLDAHIWLTKLRRDLGGLKGIGRHHVKNSLVPGIRGYPPLPHAIIARMNPKHWVLVGRITNLAFDLASILLVYLLSHLLFERVWQISFGQFISAEGAVTLLYATSPKLHPITARLQAIGGRTLGNLLVLLYFTFFGVGYLFEIPYFYLPCLLFGTLALLSSQFGMQVLVLNSVVLSCFYRDFVPLLPLLGTFGFCLLVPQLGIRQLLGRKWTHYKWYFTAIKEGTTPIAERNSLRDLVALPVYLFTRPREFCRIVFTKATPIIVVYSIPIIPMLLYWWFSSPDTFTELFSDNVIWYVAGLTLASCIAFVITSIKFALFLGEAERYLEYSLAFMHLIFVKYCIASKHSYEIVYVITLIHIGFVLVNFLYLSSTRIKNNLWPARETALEDVIEFLNGRTGQNIITIPTKFSFTLDGIMEASDSRFYYPSMSEPGRGMKYMGEDHVYLYLMKPDFDHFRVRYGANTLVTQKREVELASQRGVEYPLDSLELLYDNEGYAVYSI
jgi:hypothetical protein